MHLNREKTPSGYSSYPLEGRHLPGCPVYERNGICRKDYQVCECDGTVRVDCRIRMRRDAGVHRAQNRHEPFRDAVKPVWDKYGAKYAEWIKRIDAVT